MLGSGNPHHASNSFLDIMKDQACATLLAVGVHEDTTAGFYVQLFITASDSDRDNVVSIADAKSLGRHLERLAEKIVAS